jgi:hypothetical protein
MGKTSFTIECPCKVYYKKDGLTFQEHTMNAVCVPLPNDLIDVSVEFTSVVFILPDDLGHDVIMAISEYLHPRYTINKVSISVDLNYGFTREKRTI